MEFTNELVYRSLGTGSGMASALHPLGLHPLPRSPRVQTLKSLADPIPVRQEHTTIGFGLRPGTSPRNRPFGLGSERQLAAFIKGPHMSPAPARFGDPFGSSFGSSRPPCYAPPQPAQQLPDLRTYSRRGLNSARGLGDTTASNHSFSPRSETLLPEEAGAGHVVNGGAREPRAFHLRHADRVASYSPRGSNPYPGSMWIMPNLEAIDDL